MTPSEIREALTRLRSAGRDLRRRPAGEILERLCAVLDEWSRIDGRWCRELARALPESGGFSKATVEEGLARAFPRFDGRALRELLDLELGGVEALEGRGKLAVHGFETTAVVLAGSLPSPTLVSLLAPLTLGSPVLAKAASRDRVTPAVFRRSLEAVDPGLAACLEITHFEGADPDCCAALFQADCVVATGSDETLATISARVHPARRLVLYGHKLSVAALGPESTAGENLRRAAEGLALDVALWDQSGCLSPIAVYVVGDAPAADRVVNALADALEGAEKRWPRGPLDLEAGERLSRELAEAEMREAAGNPVRVLAGPGNRWAVIGEADAQPRPAPLNRCVRVHPVASMPELLDQLRVLGPHLAGVAEAGFGRDTEALRLGLAQIGASRVCTPGTLQAPPLTWRHDNRGVLLPLARFTSLETSLPIVS